MPSPDPPIELSAEALESLIAWIPEAVIMADSDHRIRTANQAAAELFGYEAGELLSQSLADLVPMRVRAFHAEATDSYLGKPYVRHPGSGLQLVGLRKDGSEIPVDISLNVVRYPDGPRSMAVISSASDRVGAEKRSQNMTEFVSAMSHDLRTPLNSVLGFSELLASDATGKLNKKQRRYVANVHSAGQHMLALVNDVLDLTRVESGRFQMLLEQVAIDEVIDVVITAAEPVAEASGLRLEREGAFQLRCLADPRRLRQVLDNLVSNAVKYTDAGTVTVSVESLTEHVQITIADTGPGISEQDLERIFDPFFQGSLALRHAKSGSGLGLALTQRMLRAMNGEIALESKPGLGTTARVLLPAG